MRQVDVAARDRGQRKHAEDGLGLGNVGMRRGVIAGVLPPLGNGLGFQIFKDGVVFRMEGEEGPFSRATSSMRCRIWSSSSFMPRFL